MSEKQLRIAEQQTGPAEKLADACLDLRNAIRRHESKALTHMRARLKQDVEVAERTFQNTAVSGLVYQLSEQPTLEKVRQNVRSNLFIIADTFKGTTPNTTVFWQVFETEESAAVRRPDDDMQLQIDEVLLPASEHSRRTLFNVNIQADQLNVYDNSGNEVDPEYFGLPLYIIETYRGVYPRDSRGGRINPNENT